MPDFHVTFRDLLHNVNLRHGTKGFTSFPKEDVLRIFSPWKIRRLRPGLNPRTWVPKASTLPLDHRSRLFQGYRIFPVHWSPTYCHLCSMTIQFQSSKYYPPLIYTFIEAGIKQVQQITLRGFRLPYKAGDIIRISERNASIVARSHGSECHDGKETIFIDEVHFEELILAKIINEFPAFYKTVTFPLFCPLLYYFVHDNWVL